MHNTIEDVCDRYCYCDDKKYEPISEFYVGKFNVRDKRLVQLWSIKVEEYI